MTQIHNRSRIRVEFILTKKQLNFTLAGICSFFHLRVWVFRQLRLSTRSPFFLIVILRRHFDIFDHVDYMLLSFTIRGSITLY